MVEEKHEIEKLAKALILEKTKLSKIMRREKIKAGSKITESRLRKLIKKYGGE